MAPHVNPMEMHTPVFALNITQESTANFVSLY